MRNATAVARSEGDPEQEEAICDATHDPGPDEASEALLPREKVVGLLWLEVVTLRLRRWRVGWEALAADRDVQRGEGRGWLEPTTGL